MCLRTNQRERLALVAAIDAEVGVEGEDGGFGPEFGHADEAGVGKGPRWRWGIERLVGGRAGMLA